MTRVFTLIHIHSGGNGPHGAELSVHSTLKKAIEHMAVLVRKDIARKGPWADADFLEVRSVMDILADPKRYIELLDVFPTTDWFEIKGHTLDDPEQTWHLVAMQDVQEYMNEVGVS